MTLIEPSFIHPWEFRESRRDTEEVERFIRAFAAVVLTLVLAVTVLHFTAEPNPKKAEAAITDETVLCSNPLTSGPEINRYCVSLMKRGL